VTVTIELHGIELRGFHGVLEHERTEGQRFLFDVWLDVPAPARDELAATLDYREIVAAVRDVSDGTAFQLLETLASTLAGELVARFGVTAARVRVRKPDVDLGVPADWSGVSASASASA
jgi:dihydroneopterin aldolase